MSEFLPLLLNIENDRKQASNIVDVVPFLFQFVQQYPSEIWVITHNKKTFNIEAQVFIENILVVPQEVKLISENEISIHFSHPVNGFANILTYTDTDSAELQITTTPTPTMTMTPTITPTNTVTPTPTPTVTPA